MQFDTQQVQDDRASHCWSYGSINLPSTQSRKMSIGVMVDSIPKKPAEASNEGDVARLNAEKVKNMSHLAQGKGKIVEMTTTKKTKPTEATGPVNSPWISTRPNASPSDTVPFPGRILDSPASGRQCKLDGAKDAVLTRSLRLSTNDTSVLQSDDDVRRNKFIGVSYERKGNKDRSRESTQEFTFATVQDVLRSDEEVLKEKMNATGNGRTDTLRLKLQEILGTVSSPNDHYSKSPTCELGAITSEPDKEFDQMGEAVLKPRRSYDKLFDQMADNDHYSKSPTLEFGADTSKKDGKMDQMGDAAFKPKRGSDKQEEKFDKMDDKTYKLRQNSDTIETDSDSPDNRVRRPVTRSVTRKRAPTKAQKETTKSVPLFTYKLKCKDKNIHSCKGELPRRLHAAVSGSSPKYAQQNDKSNSRVEPRRLFHFNEMDLADKVQKVTHGTETTLPAQRTSSFGNKTRDHLGLEKKIPKRNSHNTTLKNNRNDQCVDFDSPENIDQQEEIARPSARQQEHIGSPLVSNAANLQDQQEDIDSPAVRIDVNLQDLPSPTLGINTPASGSSLSSMLKKADQMGEIRGFKALQRKKSDCDDNTQIKISGAAKKLKDSLTGKASPDMEENDSETQDSEDVETSLSEPSSNDWHSESFEEASPSCDEYDRCRENDTLISETSAPKKMKFSPLPAKRLRNHDFNVQLNHINTTPPSIKGNGGSNWNVESSEHNQGDGLIRALELFALELEKLKGKIKTVTSKKSSEILMSVAKDVHLKLQNVETQIQTDMGKLKNISTLKRKRMETRFEEQQEKLQLIYETFKEQVNQHLQDCKSTFEGLEEDQLEFKGTLEKRKTSHQKLLLQAEGAVETILSDAQRKITATHELAREKMLQLKQILGLCLKEGVF